METWAPHQLRRGQKSGLGFCRPRRDPEETEGQGDPELCQEDSEDYLVLLSSSFLSSEKPEDSSSEKDMGQSERLPLTKAAIYRGSFLFQGCAGGCVPSLAGLGTAVGLGLTDAGAGAR